MQAIPNTPAPNAFNARVVFLAPSAYRLGGVQTWLDYLLPGLCERGWDPTLALVSGRFHDVDAYRAQHPYPDVIAVSYTSGTREGRLRAIHKVLTDLSPALVVGVNIADTYEAVARLRQQRATADPPRVILSLHGIQADFLQDIRRFGSILDAVVGTNRLAQQLASTTGKLAKTRCLYAPYGVKLPGPYPSPASLQGPLRIVYSGRLESFQKRVDDLPEILAELHTRGVDFHLSIAGAGPEEARLRDRLSSFGDQRVSFLGHVPYQTLLDEVYPRCHVMLVPSYWETGPIVIWEAMARGLAVVSARYIGSGLEGSLRHGENCLLYPVGDTTQAADCLSQITDDTLRANLTRAAYELVQERYTLTTSVDTWDRCLQQVLELPHLPPAQPPERAAQGRLDRLLGFGLAEHVRTRLGYRYEHRAPGGEWPHSYGHWSPEDRDFWNMAASTDSQPLDVVDHG